MTRTTVESKAALEQNKNLPKLSLRAVAKSETFNAEARTVEVVFATDAPYLREPFWGDAFYEVLSMDPAHVRMDRISSGRAPVLNTHASYELDNVIGVVETARIDGNQMVATLRFSARDDVAPIVQDIQDGILANVSVGYNVFRLEQAVGGSAEIPELVATDWEPLEISIVPIPADAAASVRAKGDTNVCTILTVRGEETKESNTMDKENQEAPGTQTPAPATPPAETANVEEVRKAAQTAERSRIAEIRNIGKTAKMTDEQVEKLISDGVEVEAVRKTALDKLSADSAANGSQRGVDVKVGEDARLAQRSAAIEQYLMYRRDPVKHKVEGLAREYVGRSLLEIARESIELTGQRTAGLTRMEIATRALNTTSDFPSILSAVANKTLRAAYDEAPQTFATFVRRTTAPDFKPVNRVQLSAAPFLEKIKESGEFKRGTLVDGKEAFKLDTFGKVVGLSRQAIVNDDMDAFGRLADGFGRQCRALESDLVYAVLSLNPTMQTDNTTLFHANHKNKNTGGTSALSAADPTSLNKARQQLRQMKDLDGQTRLNLHMTHILGGTSLETTMDQICSPALLANVANNINVYANKLVPIIEPRIDDMTNGSTLWFAIAAGQIDTIELLQLEGENGPVTETRVGFDVDGLEVKVRYDVAAAPIDWRWAVQNVGA